MENQNLWDSLFQKLDNMSDVEFMNLMDELDAMGDVPFAVAEYESETVTINIAPMEAGTYCSMSLYHNQSRYEIPINMVLDSAA